MVKTARPARKKRAYPCRLRAFSVGLRVIILIISMWSFVYIARPVGIFFFVVLLLTSYPLIRKKACPCIDIICIFDMLLLSLILFSFVGIIGTYARLPWLDMALHLLSGLILASFSFSTLYFLDHIRIMKLHSHGIVVFAFLAALSLGLFWEFFEFGWDLLITPNWALLPAQENLTDTMTDLFFDAIGALATVVLLLHASRYEPFAAWLLRPFKSTYLQQNET